MFATFLYPTKVITQVNKTPFPVIKQDSVTFAGITAVTYADIDIRFGTMVVTRVPPNLFDFEAESAKIEFTGAVYLKFGGPRKLFLGDPSRML